MIDLCATPADHLACLTYNVLEATFAVLEELRIWRKITQKDVIKSKVLVLAFVFQIEKLMYTNVRQRHKQAQRCDDVVINDSRMWIGNRYYAKFLDKVIFY